MRSIAVKFMLLFSVVLLVTAGGLSIFSYQRAVSAVQSEVENNLVQTATDTGNLISERVQSRLLGLEFLASHPAIVSMDWEQQKPLLEVEAERLNAEVLAIVTMDGIGHYPDGTTAELGDRLHIQQAFQGENAISDVLISRVSGEPVIMLAVPIKSNGQIVGVLTMRIDGFYLSGITEDVKYGENGYSFIINKEGTIIAHPDHQLVLGEVNYIEQAKSDEQYRELARVMERMIVGEAGTGIYEFDGENRYMGFSPIEGTNWSLAVGAYEEEVLAEVSGLQTMLLMITIGFMLLGLIVTFVISMTLIRPILKTVEVGELVADGDLTVKIHDQQLKRKDEIGKLANVFSKMTTMLHGMMVKINTSAAELEQSVEMMQKSSQQTSQSTSEVSQAAQEVAQQAETQMKSTSESKAAMEELATGIQRIAENATVAFSSAKETDKKAHQGNETVEKAVGQMDQIEKSADAAVATMDLLQYDSKQIGQIIQLINGISNQTNLLSLNASIEAARAGQAGKGFAVVADEIRKLSDETAQSSTKILDLITKIQQNTDQTVEAMQKNKMQIQAGKQLIEKAGKDFSEILGASKNVTAQIEDMSSVSEQMSASAEEITAAITEMTQSAEKTSERAEEVAALSEEQQAIIQETVKKADSLLDLARQLKQLLNQFKL